LSRKTLVASLVFLIPFIVYLLTLCPTVYWIDSGELIASAYTLGIAHPTGYPLYVLIGRLFSLIPGGEVATRLSLFSAVSGALASLVIFQASVRLTRNVFLSFIGAMTAAFSLNMWDLSNTAEVYSLNLLFTAIAVYILIRLRQVEGWSITHLYLLAFLTGLGMSNHLTLGAVIPSALLISFSVAPRLKGRLTASVILVTLFYAAGLSLYLFIPVRAAESPPLNWGNPRTFGGLVSHLSLASHSDYFFTRSTDQILKMMKGVGGFFFDGFGPAATILMAAGVVLLFVRRRLLAIAFLLPVLILTVFVINFGTGGRMAEEQQSFYLPVTVFAVLFFTWALCELFRHIREKWPGAAARVVFSVFVVLIPLQLFVANFHRADKSWDRSAVKFAELVYNSMERPAILLTDHTTLAFVFTYARIVEHRWSDVISVYLPLLDEEWYRKSLKLDYPELSLIPERKFSNLADFVSDNLGRYRIYTHQAYNKKVIPLRFLTPHGPVMEVDVNPPALDRETAARHRALLVPDEEDTLWLKNRSFRANIGLAHVTAASMMMTAGLYEDALIEAHEAYLLDPESSVPYLILSEIREEEGNLTEALQWGEKALRVEPQNPGAMVRVGILREKTGEKQAALELYEAAVSTSPDFALANGKLGVLMAESGLDTDRALFHLRKAVEGGYTSGSVDSLIRILRERRFEHE